MKLLKKCTLPMLVFLMMAGSVFAQGQKLKSKDISKKELNNFVTASTVLNKITTQARQDMQKMFKENNMSQRRFQMIRISQNKPKMRDTLNITKNEKKEFKAVNTKLTKKQQEINKKVKNVLDDNNLDRKRFQAIAIALRTDKDLQQRYQKIRAKQLNIKSDSNDDNG